MKHDSVIFLAQRLPPHNIFIYWNGSNHRGVHSKNHLRLEAPSPYEALLTGIDHYTDLMFYIRRKCNLGPFNLGEIWVSLSWR